MIVTLLFIGLPKFTERISLTKYPDSADYPARTSPIIPLATAPGAGGSTIYGKVNVVVTRFSMGVTLRVGLSGLVALTFGVAASPAAHADVTATSNLLRRAIDNTMSQGAFDVTTLTTCNAPRCTFSPHAFTLTSGQVLRIHGTSNDAGWYTSYRRMPSLRLLAAVGYNPRSGDWATREELVPGLRERARAAGVPATGSVYGLDDQEHIRLDERAWPPLNVLPETVSLAASAASTATPSEVSNLQAVPRADGSTLVSWSYNLTTPPYRCASGTSEVVISPAEVIISSKTVANCSSSSGGLDVGSRTSQSTARFVPVRIKGPVAPAVPVESLE